MALKILLLGERGWIGSLLRGEFTRQENVILLTTTIRVDDTIAMRAELERLRPHRVVSAIGRTHGFTCPTIDYLEDRLHENLRDNLYANLSLAFLCQELGVHFTTLGTGCIFSSTPEKEIFTEEDEPNFFGSAYSLVKGFTDRLLRFFPNALNVRIRMPISSQPHPRNLLSKLCNYKKICSIPNSMSVLDDLLPVLVRAVLSEETGTLNLVNPGSITHQEILEMYKELVDSNHEYELITLEEQRKLLKSDRSNTLLDTTKLEVKYGPIPDIKSSVRRIFMNW